MELSKGIETYDKKKYGLVTITSSPGFKNVFIITFSPLAAPAVIKMFFFFFKQKTAYEIDE